MTQVNLLPPGIRQRQRARRLTVAVLIGAAAIVVLLLLVFVLESAKLSRANRDLQTQRETNQRLQSQIGSLSGAQQLQQQVNDKQALVTSLLQGQVLWSSVLQDVSMVIPSNMYLTQFSGTLNPTAGTSGLIGSIQFGGSSTDEPTVADWLSRLEQVKGWVNPWVSSTAKSVGPTGLPVISFSGSVDLTQEATTPPKPPA